MKCTSSDPELGIKTAKFHLNFVRPCDLSQNLKANIIQPLDRLKCELSAVMCLVFQKLLMWPIQLLKTNKQNITKQKQTLKA